MKKTNFDLHLEQKLKDPDFARRFHRAGEAWDVVLRSSPPLSKATQRSQRNQRSQPSQRIKPIKRSQRIKRSDTAVPHSVL